MVKKNEWAIGKFLEARDIQRDKINIKSKWNKTLTRKENYQKLRKDPQILGQKSQKSKMKRMYKKRKEYKGKRKRWGFTKPTKTRSRSKRTKRKKYRRGGEQMKTKTINVEKHKDSIKGSKWKVRVGRGTIHKSTRTKSQAVDYAKNKLKGKILRGGEKILKGGCTGIPGVDKVILKVKKANGSLDYKKTYSRNKRKNKRQQGNIFGL